MKKVAKQVQPYEPITILGVRIFIRLTLARMTLKYLNSKARNSSLESEISKVVKELGKALDEVEQALMEWELEE